MLTNIPVKITLEKGIRRQFYVHRERLRMNALAKQCSVLVPPQLPPLVCRDGATLTYCISVDIRGPSRFVYQPDRPLVEGRGPIAWLETEAEVELTI
jgi:hypothetical protein